MRLSGKLHMISGLSDQQTIELWATVTDVHGVQWFWPSDHPTPGEHVHCYGGPDDGYGNRTLRFATTAGVVECIGPWHSNTDALYAATGVDLRATHRTWGVVARAREWDGHDQLLHGVLYEDPPEGVVGFFDRVERIAQDHADRLTEDVVFYRQARGGSSSGTAHWTRTATIEGKVVRFRMSSGYVYWVKAEGIACDYGPRAERLKRLCREAAGIHALEARHGSKL